MYCTGKFIHRGGGGTLKNSVVLCQIFFSWLARPQGFNIFLHFRILMCDEQNFFSMISTCIAIYLTGCVVICNQSSITDDSILFGPCKTSEQPASYCQISPNIADIRLNIVYCIYLSGFIDTCYD